MSTQATVNLTLNGSPVTGHEGMTILELAREKGVTIPTLCHSPELSPIGACRLCSVEVENSRTLVASCYTPIAPGMAIHTHSPKVIEARRTVVELLLASHPDNCLVCDKANRCELRRIAADLDVGLPRLKSRTPYYPVEDANPYIVRDLSKCIHCWRCVRACQEIKKANVFAIAYRGFQSKVVVDQDGPLDKDICASCEVCVSFCPVGALIKREERFLPKKAKPLVITA